LYRRNDYRSPNVPKCTTTANGLSITSIFKLESGKKVNAFVSYSSGVFPSAINKWAMGNVSLFIPIGTSLTVTPFNNKYFLNGVSTLDLILMTKHILGTQPLKSKYKLIAADVNNNGKISVADVAELKKSILGVFDSFPNNQSWKFFVDSTMKQSVFLKNISKSDTVTFVAVKIGDLNDNAGLKMNPIVGREEKEVYFDLDEKEFEAGEEIIFSPKNPDIEGYQTTIKYDEKILQPIDNQGENNNFYLKKSGTIVASEVFFDKEKKNIDGLIFRTLKSGKLSESIRFTSDELDSEVYQNEETKTLKLRFNPIKNTDFELFQNQPNPFLEETKITFSSPKKANVVFTINDINNRTIHSQSISCEKGENQIIFHNSNLTQGIYQYQINLNGEILSKKMIKL
jgi:hypothetical protein